MRSRLVMTVLGLALAAGCGDRPEIYDAPLDPQLAGRSG